MSGAQPCQNDRLSALAVISIANEISRLLDALISQCAENKARKKRFTRKYEIHVGLQSGVNHEGTGRDCPLQSFDWGHSSVDGPPRSSSLVGTPLGLAL